MDKEKLEEISKKLLNSIMIVETVRDACIATDIYNYETVLNLAIDIQQDLYDEIELRITQLNSLLY